MEQEHEGTRVLLLTEKNESFGELKYAFDALGCLSQVATNERDVQVLLRKQAFDLICVDYELAQSQKFGAQLLRENQKKLCLVLVVPAEKYAQEDFRRFEYLEWGFQDLIVNPILRESLHDILRRWERKLELSKFDTKTLSLLNGRQDGVRDYTSFAKDLSSFRHESLQLLAGYDLHLLNSLARQFTARARDAGFMSMAERTQKLDSTSGSGVPLTMWKTVLHDCEQLEKQIEYYLQTAGA